MTDKEKLIWLARATDPEASIPKNGKTFVAWHKRFYFDKNDELVEIVKVRPQKTELGNPGWARERKSRRLMYKPPEGYIR